MDNTRRAVLMIGVAGLATMGLDVAAFGTQQDDVNSLIARIRRTLDESLVTVQWQAKYKLAGMNIEDLKKTLQIGGKVTSNPVAAFGEKLDAMLNERRETLAYLVSMQNRLLKTRSKEAKGAVNDIGLEMIRRLTVKPGVFDALTAPGTHNEKVIRDDFMRLKSYDQMLRKIQDYMNSIRPAINDIVLRVNALSPLLQAYGKLAAAGLDGTYIGQFTGGGHGRIKLIVRDNVMTGSISGSCTESPCGVDPMVGTISGSVAADGTFNASLSGVLTDSSGTFKNGFPFSGFVRGRLVGATGSGDWDGKNAWGNPKGTWSATR